MEIRDKKQRLCILTVLVHYKILPYLLIVLYFCAFMCIFVQLQLNNAEYQ